MDEPTAMTAVALEAPERSTMLKLSDNRLLCPGCGQDHVHLDNAYVGGRAREDGNVQPVKVEKSGHVAPIRESDLPAPPQRRHIFSLEGWCELCPARFAFSFEQHKGNTLVSVQMSEWKTISEPADKL